MNAQHYGLSPETIEWCAMRIAQQPKRRPSWTPFILQTILDIASQQTSRPDVAIMQQLWSDFEHGIVPHQPMEIIQ